MGARWWAMGARRWVPGDGYQVMGAGCWVPGTGCQVLGAGCQGCTPGRSSCWAPTPTVHPETASSAPNKTSCRCFHSPGKFLAHSMFSFSFWQPPASFSTFICSTLFPCERRCLLAAWQTSSPSRPLLLLAGVVPRGAAVTAAVAQAGTDGARQVWYTTPCSLNTAQWSRRRLLV